MHPMISSQIVRRCQSMQASADDDGIVAVPEGLIDPISFESSEHGFSRLEMFKGSREEGTEMNVLISNVTKIVNKYF